jgi:LysR family transcriptional regulator, transcriptional activator of the cysJI operon
MSSMWTLPAPEFMLSKDFRLRVFYEAARNASFTKAGDLLSLTQPAVSFHIKSLEDDVGARLFRRTRNLVVLTEVGEILYRYAGDILALYDRAEADLARLVEHVGGNLLIGAANVVAKYVLARPLGAFKRLNPQVTIAVTAGNSEVVAGELLKGVLDVAIVSEPVDLKGFTVEPWLRDELLVIVARDHRWVARSSVALRELVGEPFIMREEGSGTRRMLERYLEQHGLDRNGMNVALTLGSTEAVKAGVESGAGVSVVSRLSVAAELQAGSLRALPIADVDMARVFNLAYPRLTYRKLAVETFLDFCRTLLHAP